MPANDIVDEPIHVRLDQFDSSIGLDRGASRLKEVSWYLCKMAFFLNPLPFPSALRRRLLIAYGAQVGRGLVIKPRVNIHFPWKLKLGEHCWLGEETWLLNFEPIELEDQVCVSQRTFLCCGNHDYRAADFRYRNAPIKIKKGAWVGAACFVAPGVTIGENTVVTAGSVVVTDLPAGKICRGNPCAPVGNRYGPRKGAVRKEVKSKAG